MIRTAAEWVAAGWNPRYAAFALTQGKQPEQMDRGPMGNLAYIHWIGHRLREYRAERGLRQETSTSSGAPIDHDDFTAWLLALAARTTEAA